MKKFLSLILALAMVACMSVTAFAVDGTTIITVEIPDGPSYTLNIPANTPLEYGKTEKQQVTGTLYVENVQNASKVSFLAPFTDLVNTADSSDKIPMKLWAKMDFEDTATHNVDPATGKVDGDIWEMYDVSWVGDEYETVTFYAQVDDWSGATPGATYRSTITYIVTTE